MGLDALGAPFGAWRRRRARRHAVAVRRLLLVRWQRFGDLVLLQPALARARELYPQARITLLAHPQYRTFLAAACPGVELWSPPSWRAAFVGAGASAVAPRAPRLSRRGPRFDLALEFHGELPWLLVARRQARRVAGYGIRGGGFLLDHPVPYAWRCDAATRQQNLVEAAARARWTPAPAPRLAPLAAWPAHAAPITPGYILLHPGCGQPAKQWPPERWRALVQRGRARGWRLAVAGGPGDRALGDWLAAGLGAAMPNLAGRLDWTELAAVVAQAACVVSADTGVAHLARALAVPTVTLFGPTDPVVWGGAGIALSHPPPCGPCHRGRCPLTADIAPCMAAIGLEEVLGAVERVLRPEFSPWEKRPPAPATPHRHAQPA